MASLFLQHKSMKEKTTRRTILIRIMTTIKYKYQRLRSIPAQIVLHSTSAFTSRVKELIANQKTATAGRSNALYKTQRQFSSPQEPSFIAPGRRQAYGHGSAHGGKHHSPKTSIRV